MLFLRLAISLGGSCVRPE